VIALVLVVGGVSLAGIVPTWRGAFLGLALQFLGVTIVLVTASGFAAGLATLITAVGIEALIAADQNISLRDGRWLVNPFAGVHLRHDNPLVRERIRRQARLRDPSSVDTSVRWFELSVIALAVVGALGVAIGRQPIAGFAGDAIVGVLILCGLLYCLLGGLPRLASGLLFVGSASNILLHEVGPSLVPAEMLLVSVGDVALALGLVYLRSCEARVSSNAEPEIHVPEPPTSAESSVVIAESSAPS
jgi:hypothetical protein